jgi:hypothetical protein
LTNDFFLVYNLLINVYSRKEEQMKPWILKGDSTNSHQSTFKTYDCNCKHSKFENLRDFVGRPKQYLLARKIKSRIKALAKMLIRENIQDLERS